jgi:hypothetical protein
MSRLLTGSGQITGQQTGQHGIEAVTTRQPADDGFGILDTQAV